MSNFINLTPHVLNVQDKDGYMVEINPEPISARCSEERKFINFVGRFQLDKVSYGSITGLPEPEENVYYIVSNLLLQALHSTRPDVVCTGKAIRDTDGKIIGCVGFSIL